MSHKLNKNAFTLAIGATALAGTMAMATATANPFEMNTLSAGYGVQGEMGAKGEEGKCGGSKSKSKEASCGANKAKEASCGGDKAKAEGKCGEGKCGMAMMDTDKDGKVTKEEFMAAHEKMFAAKDTNKDGSLDAAEMKAGEGSCGGAKGKKEGKCGEGKCGANKKK